MIAKLVNPPPPAPQGKVSGISSLPPPRVGEEGSYNFATSQSKCVVKISTIVYSGLRKSLFLIFRKVKSACYNAYRVVFRR